jgi:aryl-alcohol dehydrogenase-like predicted oxidoreductase
LSAGGLLAQAHPYARDFTHGRLLGRGHALALLSEDQGLDSVYELALRFALAKPGISCVLIGFSNMEQLEQVITWAGRGALSSESVRRVLDLAAVDDSATMPNGGTR